MELFNLPNKLTLSRIGVVPIILVLIYLNTKVSCLVAAGLFILSSITDILDGYLARRANLVTSLGKFLDPLADKVLVSSVLIMFVSMQWAPVWVAIIIVCRDIMVTGLRAIAADEGIVIAADKYGKIKTVFQMVAITPMIIHYPYFEISFEIIGRVLIYISVVLTVFSGANYFYSFFTLLNKKNKEVPSTD